MSDLERYKKFRDGLVDRINEVRDSLATRGDVVVGDGIVDPEWWFGNTGSGTDRILFIVKESVSSTCTDDWNEDDWLYGCRCMTEKAAEKTCNCSKGKACVERSQAHSSAGGNCEIKGRTFNAVAEWLYSVEQYRRGEDNPAFCNWLGIEPGDSVGYANKRRELLRKIAWVNIKKVCDTLNGKKAISSNMDLAYHASVYRDILKEQIECIHPSLIVCCGTYDHLRIVLPELPRVEGPALPSSKDSVKWVDFDSPVDLKYAEIPILRMCHPNSRCAHGDMFEEFKNRFIQIIVAGKEAVDA